MITIILILIMIQAGSMFLKNTIIGKLIMALLKTIGIVLKYDYEMVCKINNTIKLKRKNESEKTKDEVIKKVVNENVSAKVIDIKAIARKKK